MVFFYKKTAKKNVFFLKVPFLGYPGPVFGSENLFFIRFGQFGVRWHFQFFKSEKIDRFFFDQK